MVKRVWQAGYAAMVFVICGVLVFPIYWILVCSTKTGPELFRTNLSFVPTLKGFAVFAEIFRVKPMLRWLFNTSLVGIATTTVCLAAASCGAYSLSRFKFKGKSLFQFMILSTQMIPGVMIVVPIFIIFDHLGLRDTLSGAIIAFISFSLPLCVFLLRGFFDSLPGELEQAAMIDGCTRIGAFTRVILPLSTPGLGATATFSFLIAWGEYLFSRTLITSDGNWLVTMGISHFITDRRVLWEQMMASGLIVSLPPVIVFLFLQKYIVQGLTAGAIKG